MKIMVVHYRDDNLFLLQPEDLLSNTNFLLPKEINSIAEILDWVRGYLCKPNHDLGRKGDVCPFTKLSLDIYKAFYITCCRDKKLNVESTVEMLLKYRDWFKKIEPIDMKFRNFKTVVIVFPNIPIDNCSTLFDKIQMILKPHFVEESLMLGEFYPSCEKPGLHNYSYKPLRSPIPLFVIRYMQLTDLPFLVHKQQFINAYCNTFNIFTREELELCIDKAGISKLPTNWEENVDKIFGTKLYTGLSRDLCKNANRN